MANSIFKKLQLLAYILCCTIYAQEYNQTLRGNVVDKVSQSPLANVVVILDETNAVETDSNGKFKFLDVHTGKHNLIFNFEGYKTLPVPNVTVNSGKETVLNINMEEDITVLENVVIGNKVEKNNPLNTMSTVSTRVFSVEETQKYAAAVNDPARMASAFAGVVSADDGNNGISIRGNSPNGLLWRMEGVDIPNPNHFTNVGTSGGGVSIISSQLLTNSDFSTGAFAAEYGNALSGVFDIKLRKGNNEKREYTLQAGFLGLDAAIEGPFKKGYEGSYLINYRYSTLGIISKIVNLFDAVTLFKDLSYNIYLPTNKLGKFTLFGINGWSSQTTEAKTDTSLWNIRFNKFNTEFFSNTSANGLTYSQSIHNKMYIKSAFVASQTLNRYDVDEVNKDFDAHEAYREKYLQTKLTLNTTLNYKLNVKNTLRSGFIVNRYGFEFKQNKLIDSTNKMEEYVNHQGNSESGQLFTQWQYRINEKLTTNLGIHYIQFFLNNKKSIEPRASIKYNITPKQSFSLGYGLHSQIMPLSYYFAKVQDSTIKNQMPNKSLGLAKAHHIVLGYDRSINDHLRIKLETYYQKLFNIPQGTIKSENYSVLNQQGGNINKSLVNDGTGQNYGIELTLEHFMHKNFYLLSSSSLYDSKYKGTDGKNYNTLYNGNYAFSLTAGKEIKLKNKKEKDRSLSLNFKSYYTGGFRRTPLDFNATFAKGEEVYIHDKSFQDQNPAYFRTDIKISLKRNYKKLTSTLSLDIQNVTNRKNVGGQYYDTDTKEIKYWYQTPLIPILSYKLEF